MCTKCDENTTITKQCGGICGQVKSLFNFYACSNSPDGHRKKCKNCEAKRFKARTDKIKESEKEYVEFKKCGQCKEIRHRDLFSNNNATKTGLASKCRICVKEMCQTEEYKEYSSQHAKKSRKNKRKKKEAELMADKLSNPEKYIVQPKQPRKKEPFKVKTYVEFKNCTGNDSCGELKHRTEFGVNNYISTGLNNTCKTCDRKIANFPENKEKARVARIKYLSVEENKRKTQDVANVNAQKKRDNDPAFKLRGNVTRAINELLKKTGGSKNHRSILKYLPYTIKELKKYLEKQFIDENAWMNWNNYGKISKTKRTWQIDHIYPQSLLPYTSMEDENFKLAWALSNLQPLEAFANIRKSNKIITPTPSVNSVSI